MQILQVKAAIVFFMLGLLTFFYIFLLICYTEKVKVTPIDATRCRMMYRKICVSMLTEQHIIQHAGFEWKFILL